MNWLFKKTFSGDYNKGLDKSIKTEFQNKLKLTHPCEFQQQNCPKGSECPFIGIANNICVHHIRGRCKFDHDVKYKCGQVEKHCRYEHNDDYANLYRTTKEKFKKEQGTNLAKIKTLGWKGFSIIKWCILVTATPYVRKVPEAIFRSFTELWHYYSDSILAKIN